MDKQNNLYVITLVTTQPVLISAGVIGNAMQRLLSASHPAMYRQSEGTAGARLVQWRFNHTG